MYPQTCQNGGSAMFDFSLARLIFSDSVINVCYPPLTDEGLLGTCCGGQMHG